MPGFISGILSDAVPGCFRDPGPRSRFLLAVKVPGHLSSMQFANPGCIKASIPHSVLKKFPEFVFYGNATPSQSGHAGFLPSVATLTSPLLST